MPLATQKLRALSAMGLLRRSAATVARPRAVSPMIWMPSSLQLKVLPPPTAVWVEELAPSTCLWIASDATLFKLIAQWAAETEVLKCCLAACRPRENVIQMKSRQGQLLQGQTVLTTSICHSDDTCTEGLRNTGHTVECLLFVWRSMPGQLHNVARPGFLHQSYLVFRYQCLKLFALS